MILRNTNNIDSKLEGEMTVGEFIKEIIEKDKECYLKYYRIALKANLHCRNMILYYQAGILKSQHTTGCKMGYIDYLNHEIRENYGADYITIDNIMDFEHDSDRPDPNLVEETEGKSKSKKKKEENKDIFDKALEEFKENGKGRDRVIRVQYSYGKEVSYNDLVECVKQMAHNMNSYNSDEKSTNRECKRLQKEKEILYSQVKWLEYKINLNELGFGYRDYIHKED